MIIDDKDRPYFQKYDVNTGEMLKIKIPEKSEWTMSCANINYTPDKGKEPNWFHRKMQEWLLGFKWRKNK